MKPRMFSICNPGRFPSQGANRLTPLRLRGEDPQRQTQLQPRLLVLFYSVGVFGWRVYAVFIAHWSMAQVNAPSLTVSDVAQAEQSPSLGGRGYFWAATAAELMSRHSLHCLHSLPTALPVGVNVRAIVRR